MKKYKLVLLGVLGLAGCDIRLSANVETGQAVYSKSKNTVETDRDPVYHPSFWEILAGDVPQIVNPLPGLEPTLPPPVVTPLPSNESVIVTPRSPLGLH